MTGESFPKSIPVACVLAAALCVSRSSAVNLTGVVVDDQAAAIEGAFCRLVAAGLSDATGSDGTFALTDAVRGAAAPGGLDVFGRRPTVELRGRVAALCLPQEQSVSISVADLRGRTVRATRRVLGAGRHIVPLVSSATRVTARGTYVVAVSGDGFCATEVLPVLGRTRRVSADGSPAGHGQTGLPRARGISEDTLVVSKPGHVTRRIFLDNLQQDLGTIVLDSDAWGCSGVNVAPGDNLDSVMDAHSSPTTFCIEAGIHRVSTYLTPGSGDTLWGEPGAAISGAVVIDSWTAQSGKWYADGHLPAPYTGTGTCEDDVNNPCLLGENIFRDGALLDRVMSVDSVGPGSFHADYAANRVWIGDDPAGALMEMASTTRLIGSGSSNVTLLNLIVEKSAVQGQSGAIQFTGSGWTIRGCEIRQNHGTGIRDYGGNARIVDNYIHHNGQLGIGGNAISGTVIDSNEIGFNNTDGFWVMDWEGGGIKYCRASFTVRDNHVYDNLCVGVWIDIDCKGVTIERNLIENNAADGIRYEISYDGIIRNNACVNNDFYVGRNKGTNLYYGGGINVHTSSNVDVYGNTVADNLNGIGLVRTNRGTGDYGVWDLVDVTVHDNTITMSSGVSGLRQNVGDDTYYTGKGNGFQDNTYYLDDFSAERFWWMNGVRTRDEWTAYGQDTTGAFYLIE